MRIRSSKVVVFLLTFFILLSQVFTSSFALADNKVPFTIFHTNDMHGRLGYEEYKGTPTSFGSAREKALIDKEKQENPDRTVVTLDAGDAFQGLPVSNQSKGEDMAKAMNEIGYKAMTAGNHEFDFGLDTVEKYKNNPQNGGWLNFPMVSTNVYKDGKRLFEPSTILNENGVKIGIVGVTTPETATKTNPTGIQGVTFTKPIPEVTKEISRIKDQVDFIAVLAHLGDDTTTIEDEKGSALAAALRANPLFSGISILVIDGHSHQLIQDEKSSPVHHVQAKSYLEYIGKMTFDYNKDTKKIENFKSIMLSAKDNAKDLTPDAKVEKIVKAAQNEFAAKGSVVVIDKSPYTLEGTSENVRTKETNLGNLIADALYNSTKFDHESDFAVTNGGGIRTTLSKDLPVTVGDIIKVMPFGNQLTQIQVKGSDVKKMYEHSLRALINEKDGKEELDAQGKPQLGSNGGFLQSSSSIKVVFDPHRKAGDRVLSIHVLNKKTGEFEPLDPNRTYYVATNDFLAVGGDGYTMLGGARNEGGATMDDVVVNYIKQLSPEQFLAYQDPFPYSRIIPGIKPFVPETKPANPVNDGNVITDNNGVSHQTGQPAIQDALPEYKVEDSTIVNPNIDKVTYPQENIKQSNTNNNNNTSTNTINNNNVNNKEVKHFRTASAIKGNVKTLPNTGTTTDASMVGLGLLAATSLVISRRKANK